MLVERYHYPKLTREMRQGTRFYTDGKSAAVPSVTTILDKTADKTHLIAWRKRIGVQEAAKQTKEAAGFGTLVHNSLEKYSLGEDWQITGSNFVQTLARQAVTRIVEDYMPDVDEFWGVEVPLIAQDLYAGTTDAVGVHKGDEAIIDFKTSKKIKKREWITDYFLQCCAYALAHNEMHGTNIRKGVILMADREGNSQEYIIEGEEFDKYAAMWSDRVYDYYVKFGA